MSGRLTFLHALQTVVLVEGGWRLRTALNMPQMPPQPPLQGSLFVVEELVDGGSLRTMVSRQAKDRAVLVYRTVDALRWLLQVGHLTLACHGPCHGHIMPMHTFRTAQPLHGHLPRCTSWLSSDRS